MNQARVYSKYNGLQKNDAKFVIDNYFDLVKWNPEQDEVILDVGCGDGNVTIDLILPAVPENVQKLMAVDLSKEMIEFAKNNNSRKKVEYAVTDIGAKEIDLDEKFNHIFSFYCLHWVQDQRQCFENLYSLLERGGDTLITFLAKNPIFVVYTNLANNNRWARYMKDYKKFISPYQDSSDPGKDLHVLMADAGFNVLKCELVDREFIFEDIETWKQSVIAVNPFISRIPDSLREDYIDDFFEEVRKMKCIVKNKNNNEEKLEVKYQLFVVYASREM